MAIYRRDGKHRVRQYNKKASTAIALGEIMTGDANGFALPAVAASTQILGVSMQRVGTDSSDYATATPTLVDRPDPNDQFVMDTTGGPPTQAMVGELFDLSNSTTVNLAASTLGIVKLVGLAGGTQAVFEFNPVRLFETAI